MKTLRQALVVGLMVTPGAGIARAQTFTGGVRGAVRDANGVMPGVDGGAHQRSTQAA